MHYTPIGKALGESSIVTIMLDFVFCLYTDKSESNVNN